MLNYLLSEAACLLPSFLFDCRANIEKIQSSQDLLESKELTVISISLFLACFAFFKLVFARVLTLFKTCESDMRNRNKREWLLIFVSSSLTILITLLYG